MMHRVKIRHVGNSEVVTLPKALRGAGLTAGAELLLEPLADGQILLTPLSGGREALRKRIRQIGRRVIAEEADTLALLAAYDRGECPELDERSSLNAAHPARALA